MFEIDFFPQIYKSVTNIQMLYKYFGLNLRLVYLPRLDRKRI
jgi:hypothetical protein